MTADPASTARLLEIAHEGQPRPAISLGLALLANAGSLEELIVDVLAPVQREVGELWETNQWGVADEHAATAVVDGVLGALSLEVPAPAALRGHVVVACAEGEHHTLPARMGTEILREAGWDVLFVGGSMPADDLQCIVAEREPDAVLISCTIPVCLPGARRCFAAIAELGLPALGAGAAFGADERRARRLGARGWLGPGVDLGSLLEDGRMPEIDPWPTPPEALVLGLDRPALLAACRAALQERMADATPASRSLIDSTGVDLQYVLGCLTAAVDLGDDEFFEECVVWFSGVLCARDVEPSRLGRALWVIGEVLEAAGLADAARLCAAPAGALTSP